MAPLVGVVNEGCPNGLDEFFVMVRVGKVRLGKRDNLEFGNS